MSRCTYKSGDPTDGCTSKTISRVPRLPALLEQMYIPALFIGADVPALLEQMQLHFLYCTMLSCFPVSETGFF